MNAPGFWEIGFLGVLALLIFGPNKLPDIARTVGRTYGALRREARATIDELKRSADLDDVRGVARELRETTADLKRSATLTGPVASGARAETTAGSDGKPTVRARAAGGDPAEQREVTAPFDPDAT